MAQIWPEIEDPNFMNDNHNVLLIRNKSEKVQTLGVLMYQGKEIARTIELPWIGNEYRVSCIPTGSYDVVRRKSPKYGDHFHVQGVPGRSYILIHHGNYFSDFLGCIGVGFTHADINKDGHLDVTASKAKMKELLLILPQQFKLIISNQ